MGHRERIWAITGLAVIGGVVACVGGAGGPFDPLEVWEPTARTGDRVQSSTEGASPTTERAPQLQEPSSPTAEPAPGAQTGRPGAGGTSGLDCSGTYECREPDGDRSTLTFTERNGECTTRGAIVHPDGRITINGRQIGTWTGSTAGFSFTTDDGTTTCVPRGSGNSGGTDESQRPPPPSTTGEPPGTDSPPPADTGSPPEEPPEDG